MSIKKSKGKVKTHHKKKRVVYPNPMKNRVRADMVEGKNREERRRNAKLAREQKDNTWVELRQSIVDIHREVSKSIHGFLSVFERRPELLPYINDKKERIIDLINLAIKDSMRYDKRINEILDLIKDKKGYFSIYEDAKLVTDIMEKIDIETSIFKEITEPLVYEIMDYQYLGEYRKDIHENQNDPEKLKEVYQKWKEIGYISYAVPDTKGKPSVEEIKRIEESGEVTETVDESEPTEQAPSSTDTQTVDVSEINAAMGTIKPTENQQPRHDVVEVSSED